MASNLTPEQAAFFQSLPQGHRITPTEAAQLGWTQNPAGFWLDAEGQKIGLGRSLPKAGDIFNKNTLMLSAAVLGGPLLAAQALPSAAASSTLPAGTAPALGAPATAASTAATTAAGGASSVLPAAAGGLSSFWGKALLGIGGDLLNGYFANRGANKAADELNKSADKQIALYGQALGPYMDPGPINLLKGLQGIPTGGGAGASSMTPIPGAGAPLAPGLSGSSGRLAPPDTGAMGMAAPRQGGTLASIAPQQQAAQQQTASSFVRMRLPQTGEEGDVHPSQVKAAMAEGAVPLQGY